MSLQTFAVNGKEAGFGENAAKSFALPLCCGGWGRSWGAEEEEGARSDQAREWGGSLEEGRGGARRAERAGREEQLPAKGAVGVRARPCGGRRVVRTVWRAPPPASSPRGASCCCSPRALAHSGRRRQSRRAPEGGLSETFALCPWLSSSSARLTPVDHRRQDSFRLRTLILEMTSERSYQ